MKTTRLNVCFMLIVATLVCQCANIDAQIFDQLVNRQNQSADRPNDSFSRLMSVNVPMFYDMVRNGSSMGINVLSGLVKVERGDEGERNGLMGNGRRPLSVRIFGVPVYERGVRVRPPSSGSSSPKANGGEEEDSSVEPLAV